MDGHDDIGGGAGDGAAAAAGAVTARLFAGLERVTGDPATVRRVPVGQAPTVAALCAATGLAADAAGLILVNGVHAALSTALKDGDEVSLFPLVGGG